MIEEMTPARPPGSSDPGWEHGIAQDEKKKKVKCNYCGKIVSGGIYRLKQHLARISGEVTYCKKAPEEVYIKMKENLEGCRASKRQRQPEDEEQVSFDLYPNDDDNEDFPGSKQKRNQDDDDKSIEIFVPPLRSLGFVDPGWEHGVAQDERKKKVKCNYCDKIVSGGINRFKQHLARIPGEVAYCKMAPEEVYLQMKENMKWHRTGRRRRPEVKEPAISHVNSDNDNAGEDEELNRKSREKQAIYDKSVMTWMKTSRKRSRRMSPVSGTCVTEPQAKLSSVSPKTERSQMPVTCKKAQRSENDKKNYKEVISTICKFIYHVGVPVVAANFACFQKMIDSVSQYGQGLKVPSSQLISGHFLQEEVATLKESLIEFKTSWMVTGCTIMADSWKNVQGRTLINFLVSCPRGTYFVTSVDASDVIEDATNLFKLLDQVVEDVGEENVVQVVTEASLSYKAAGKMLEEKRKKLFWTPCAAYCIDRMLEDFVKIKWVGECLYKGQTITKFIYNRSWLLNLMKKEFTAGRELLKPTVTKFASSFVTLQNLLEHRLALKRMFQSEKWMASQYSQLDEGKEIEKIVLNSTFWKKMQYVKKSVDPILQVLLKVNSDKGLSMPFVYNNMYKARLAIKEIHGDEMRKYGPFWSVIDNHWNSLFNHPLYLAAYFLNPAYRYRQDFLALPEIMRGLNDCIVRLETDSGRRVCASMQISDFVSAKADFGTELAIGTRMELDPAAWWQQHGINCLELQRIAIRILSQTSSSFGCEHSWSAFDQIHSTRRNQLAQKMEGDLIYVHYNLRLKEHQLKRQIDESSSLDNVLLESLLGDWIIETEKPSLSIEEGILYTENGQAGTYENRVNSNNDLEVDARQEPTDGTTLPDVMEPQPLEVLPGVIDGGVAEDGDADLDFLDENLSD